MIFGENGLFKGAFRLFCLVELAGNLIPLCNGVFYDFPGQYDYQQIQPMYEGYSGYGAAPPSIAAPFDYYEPFPDPNSNYFESGPFESRSNLIQSTPNGKNTVKNKGKIKGDVFQTHLKNGQNTIHSTGQISGDVYQSANVGKNTVSGIIDEAEKSGRPVNVYMSSNMGPAGDEGEEGKEPVNPMIKKINQVTSKGSNRIRRKQKKFDPTDYNQSTNEGSNKLVLTHRRR